MKYSIFSSVFPDKTLCASSRLDLDHVFILWTEQRNRAHVTNLMPARQQKSTRTRLTAAEFEAMLPVGCRWIDIVESRAGSSEYSTVAREDLLELVAKSGTVIETTSGNIEAKGFGVVVRARGLRRFFVATSPDAEVPASVQFKAAQELRGQWQEAASSAGVPFEDWARMILNEAARKELGL